jgi:hypothetical protein
LKKKFVMDEALEDKLCDLYDIFVDGLDEDPGPQIRKLYGNLAELWPNRLMDNHGIKRAICRGKERQRALCAANLGKEMDQTKMKNRRKQLVPRTDSSSRPNTSSVVQLQHSEEKRAVDPSPTTQPMVDSSRDRSNEKLKGSSSSCNPAEEARLVKRKTEPVVAEKQVVLALKSQEQPQARVIAAPRILNIPEASLDLNLPS